MAEPGYDDNGDPLIQGVISATGVSVHASFSGNEVLAERMEREMTAEVQKCYDEGATDPEQIKARVLAVRDAIRDWDSALA